MKSTTTRKSRNTIKRDYVKLWLRSFHFIWDNRNHWIVFGLRTKSRSRYFYHSLGPFNVIGCVANVKKNSPWDLWLRCRWGDRETPRFTGFIYAMLGRLW